MGTEERESLLKELNANNDTVRYTGDIEELRKAIPNEMPRLKKEDLWVVATTEAIIGRRFVKGSNKRYKELIMR